MRFFLLISILFVLLGCRKTSQIVFQKEIDSISHKWVPDKREGICDVKAIPSETGVFILKGETTYGVAKEEILKLAERKLLSIIDSVELLPAANVGKRPYGVVTLSCANLRTKPQHSAELASQAILGSPVKVLRVKNDWILIQTPDNYIAWTNRTSVKTLTDEEFQKWRKSERLIYNANYGFVYRSAEMTDVVSDLVLGSILAKISESPKAYQVQFPDGRQGFVSKENFTNFDEWRKTVSPTHASISKVARTFLGSSYLWGGTTSKALDCSGFTKTVYFQHGILLARDASLQYKHGKTIDKTNDFKNLEVGDLLFFANDEENKTRITHVGMYIADTEFIHASGRVTINSLDSTRKNFNKFLRGNLLGIKRVIGETNIDGIVPVSKHQLY